MLKLTEKLSMNYSFSGNKGLPLRVAQRVQQTRHPEAPSTEPGGCAEQKRSGWNDGR